MADEKQGSAAMGCLSLVLLLVVGSCVFGGTTEQNEAEPVETVTADAASIAKDTASENKPEVSGEIERNAEAVMGLDQGQVNYDDLSDADRAIRLAINRAGHLCAKPILVLPESGDDYRVLCIRDRSGSGRSTYIVNASSERVIPL